MSYEVHFGNGTTALVAVLSALGCRGKRVAIPGAVCLNVPAAVIASGNVPYLVDIECDTMGMSPERLDSIYDEIGAVVAVHAYGMPCRIDDLSSICQRRGIPLIEDCAQAEGATYLGRSVGRFGDAAVRSYGAGKIIDVGGGGSAITADSGIERALRRFAAELPEGGDHAAGEAMAAIFKFFYNNFYPDRLDDYSFVFTGLVHGGNRMLARADVARVTDVERERARLAENLLQRRGKAAQYRLRLGSRADVDLIEAPDGSAPWRFNLLLAETTRDAVLRFLLKEGEKVSSWYPALHHFFGSEAFPRTDLTNAERIGARILNLWLDASTSEDDVNRVCGKLVRFLDRAHREKLASSAA